MKLSDIRASYEFSTGKLSDINRQLCFTGIAIIWIFNKEPKNINIPINLYIPSLCFIISLSFDLLQYIAKSIIWYWYYCNQKKKNKEKREDCIDVSEPEKYNIILWVFFFLKILFLIGGFLILGYFLYKNINI